MERKKMINCAIIFVTMFVLTAVLLAVMSAVIWKTDAGTGAVSGCVIAIYIIVDFIGGFLMGKMAGKHKFLWGIAAGAAYFAVILLAGIWIMGGEINGNADIISTAMICIISGMFGGMIAP